MTDAAGHIRPRVDYLRQLPTLKKMTPEQGSEDLQEFSRREAVDFVWELKLITPEVRYWLCSKGLAEPRPGIGEEWVVGWVTPEYLVSGGTGEFGDPYNAESEIHM